MIPDGSTVAVTGASGFVGSHLVKKLRQKDCKVRILIHRNSPEGVSNVETVRGSVTHPESLKELVHGVSTVYHLASALGNRGLSKKGFYQVNVEGTRNVIRQCDHCGVKHLVHFSSAGVYGRTGGKIPLKEDHPLYPVDPYEVTKKEAEDVVREYSPRVHSTIIRPGWVFGEGDRRTFKLIRQIYRGPFFLTGDVEKMQSPVYVEDLVNAVCRIPPNEDSGMVYNVGGLPVSIRFLCHTIARVLGREIPSRRVPLSLVYPAAALMEGLYRCIPGKEAPLNRAKLAFFMRGKPLDSTRAAEKLDFSPSGSLYSHMKTTVQWYQEAGWLSGGS